MRVDRLGLGYRVVANRTLGTLNASRDIKVRMGNPDAAASAYSLYDYAIAHDLVVMLPTKTFATCLGTRHTTGCRYGA